MMVASVAGHLTWIPFLIVGLAMLVWNRRVADATTAGMKSFYDTLGFEPLKRLNDFVWRPSFVRGFVIVSAVVYIGIALVGLIVG